MFECHIIILILFIASVCQSEDAHESIFSMDIVFERGGKNVSETFELDYSNLHLWKTEVKTFSELYSLDPDSLYEYTLKSLIRYQYSDLIINGFNLPVRSLIQTRC